MGKITETKVNKFDGGIVNDPRDTRENTSSIVTNFDILTDPSRMIPYRDSEDGDSSSTNNKIHNFCIGRFDGTPTYALYGLGQSTTGTSRAKVFRRSLTDLTDATWTDGSNNESSANDSGATNSELFVYYENQGEIYIADIANDKIMTFTTDEGTAWDESVALTMTHVTNGIVHSKDDICYFGYYNSANGTSGIYKKNGANAWASALTLPKNFRPTIVREYGNYIAIAGEIFNPTAPGFGGSTVYLWDRDATLNTLSESISWGDDRLMVLDEINGSLIGISFTTATARFNPRITFRYLSVGETIEFATFTPTKASGTPDLLFRSQKVNNRLYFMSEMQMHGANRDGVWSVSGTPGNFRIVHERTISNDTALDNENDALVGFFFVGDYLFQSYTDSSVYKMTKTNDSASYTATSIYEKLFNTIDSSTFKKLVGATVMFEPFRQQEL